MNILLRIAGIVFIALTLQPAAIRAQRSCGTALRYQHLATENPAQLAKLRAQQKKHTEDAIALMNTGTAYKNSSAQSPIPVVFHFILTQDQYAYLGNDSGIKRRVYSQIRALNADFNKKNADSTLIPAAFKRLYGNANIQFAFAKATNSNTIAPGIERKILPSSVTPTYSADNEVYNAKEATAIGFKAWDVTKYLNIWVVDVTSASAGGAILGITTPPSIIGYSAGGHTIVADDLGIVLNYQVTGAREFAAQNFLTNIDLGRTLTHEAGHYFELGHIWGDDDGKCPTNGGQDDFITDTPPAADATYCNATCPTFPKTDACSPTSPGIMFMNFMDYVDDRAMQMFTTEQAAVMRAVIQPGQESYSLTQNPTLGSLSISSVPEHAFSVYPNPATDEVVVSLDGSEKLLSIDVVNMMGQSVYRTAASNLSTYPLQLANVPRGIYFVQCHFAEGILTKKIVLQ